VLANKSLPVGGVAAKLNLERNLVVEFQWGLLQESNTQDQGRKQRAATTPHGTRALPPMLRCSDPPALAAADGRVAERRAGPWMNEYPAADALPVQRRGHGKVDQVEDPAAYTPVLPEEPRDRPRERAARPRACALGPKVRGRLRFPQDPSAHRDRDVAGRLVVDAVLCGHRDGRPTRAVEGA